VEKRRLFAGKALSETLAASVAGGRLCHAYLFYGEKGVGKRTLAEHFGQMILCTGASPRPCGECASCRKFLSGNHPDFYRYEGRSGANAIHIETVREVRADVYIRPNDGEYKVYLLPDAEDMTVSAANALLKVLEEPPTYAVFLLTASHPERVPLTVRSRCIRLEVYPLSFEETVEALRELLPEKEEQALRQAAELSGGVLGQALAMLQDEACGELSALAGEIMSGLLAGNEYQILASFAGAGQDRGKLTALLVRLSGLLRAALRIRLGVSRGEDPLAVALSQGLTAGRIAALSSLLEEGARAIEGNANLSLLQNYLAAGMMTASDEGLRPPGPLLRA